MNIKIAVYTFVLISIFSCKKEKEYVFTEEEAYKLMNEYFIKEISKKDTFLLFNTSQLKQPDYNYTNYLKNENGGIESISIKPPLPYPIFTKRYWNTNKINEVKIIESKEWFSYFSRKSNLEKKWINKYGYNEAHNVSYPIYNSKTKIAVIKDYVYRPFDRDCFLNEDIYVYKKTENSWILLTKY